MSFIIMYYYHYTIIKLIFIINRLFSILNILRNIIIIINLVRHVSTLYIYIKVPLKRTC